MKDGVDRPRLESLAVIPCLDITAPSRLPDTFGLFKGWGLGPCSV